MIAIVHGVSIEEKLCTGYLRLSRYHHNQEGTVTSRTMISLVQKMRLQLSSKKANRNAAAVHQPLTVEQSFVECVCVTVTKRAGSQMIGCSFFGRSEIFADAYTIWEVGTSGQVIGWYFIGAGRQTLPTKLFGSLLLDGISEPE